MSTIQLASDYHLVHCGSGNGCMNFAMPIWFYNQTRRTGETWYCPLGHPRVWKGQTTEAELEAARARNTHLEDQLRSSVEEAERTRHQLLRDRRRFANGVCPCCNRSFTNVRRHMATQHPDYDVTNVEGTVAFPCSCGRTFDSLGGLRTHQGHQRHGSWWKPDTPRWRAHLTRV